MGNLKYSEAYEMLVNAKKYLSLQMTHEVWSASDIIVIVLALGQLLYAKYSPLLPRIDSEYYRATANNIKDAIGGSWGWYARYLILDRNMFAHKLGSTEHRMRIEEYVNGVSTLREFILMQLN